MSTRTVLPPEERKKELSAWLQAFYDVSSQEYIEKNELEGQPSLSELYKKVTGRPCGGPYHKAIMDLGVIRKLEKKEKRNQELKIEAAKDMQREYFNEVQGDRILIACKKANKEPKEIPNKENNLNLYGAYKDILEGVKRLEEKVGSLYYRNTPDHIRATVYDAMSGAILSAEQKLGVQLKLYSDRELVEELRERGYKIKFGRLVVKGSKRKFKL